MKNTPFFHLSNLLNYGIIPSTIRLRQGLVNRTLKDSAPNPLFKNQKFALKQNAQSWGLTKRQYLPNDTTYVKKEDIDVTATKNYS